MEPVNFDRAVGYYDETRGFPPGEEIPIATLIAEAGRLTQTSRVLEIGVGTGRIALPLANHVGSIHGVDISAKMVTRLLAKLKDEPVFPVQANVTHLPYASSSFDTVIAAHVFHLIGDLDSTLAELDRVLRPGGCLLRCWNYKTGPFDDLYRVWRAHTPDPKRDYFRSDRHLRAAGWQKLGDEHSYSFTFLQSPQTTIDWFRHRVGSSTWDLTDAEIALGVAALEAFIHERFDDPDTAVPGVECFYVAQYLPPQN